jgi:soluble lytic murein transglycosylase-like protein
MRSPRRRMKVIFVLFLAMSVLTIEIYGQEPRLPAPAETPSPDEALIRRARDLYAAGNYRESAAAWQTVAVRQAVIASLAREESVRALIAAGDLEPAMTGLAEVGVGAPAELLLLVADGYRSVKNFNRAAALYSRAREVAGRTPVADEAALGLARTLEDNGQAREGLETYRELQLTFRQASAFDAADAGARRLSTQLENADPLTEADYETIVDRLAGVAAFRRAVDMQAEWLATFPDSPRKVNVESAMVQNLYLLRANDEARSRAAAFLKQYAGTADVHEVVITLFRLDVREGRTPDVEKRGLAILGGQVAGTTLSDRQSAARLLAEYLLSVGQPAKALGVFDQLYKITRTRSARIDVLWRTAIVSLRAGSRTRALKALQDVLDLRPDSETERAATFWLAYAQYAAGSKETAKKHWASIAQRYPFSYYGTRAASRIGAALPEPSITFPNLSLGDLVTAHPDYQAATLLARAGLATEAAIYARRLNAAFRRDDAVALLAARASEMAADHSSAATLMSSYFGPYLQRPASNLPDDFWSLAYPRAYWPQVYSAASRHGVDPLLMLGLARQESHFERMARSPVGAVGLFQIMPYTAAELDPAFSNPAALDRLTDADVSSELAAKLIASLQGRYQGALAPTIASYNADKERVQVWWDSAKGLSEELFIDSIPYQQTRAYVRQVLVNYAMYQRSAQSASPKK